MLLTGGGGPVPTQGGPPLWGQRLRSTHRTATDRVEHDTHVAAADPCNETPGAVELVERRVVPGLHAATSPSRSP